ncbi:FlgT C-terminal domain-containing protein [Shewanella sp. 10N.286.52.E4]
MNQLFQQSTQDIDNLLNCRPLLGQIVAKQGNRIIINLGRKNNVKMGDNFQIVLQQNIPDRVNLMRAVATKNRATVTIEQVSEESATAVLEGIGSTGNIQVQDIVIKI